MSNYQMTLFLPKYHYMPQEERIIQIKPGNAIISKEDNVDKSAEGRVDFVKHSIYFKNIPKLLDESFSLDDAAQLPKQAVGLNYRLRKDQKGPLDNELVTSSALFAGHTRWQVQEPIIVKDQNGQKILKKLYWNQNTMEADAPADGETEEDSKSNAAEVTLLSLDEADEWLHKRDVWQQITFVNEPIIKYRVQPLGLAVDEDDPENKKIPDSAFASSTQESGYEAFNARLNSGSCWAPTSTDGKPFLEVDLGMKHYVAQLQIQGTSSGYVKKFKLHYSMNGVTYHPVDRIFEPENPEFDDYAQVETYFVNPVVHCQFLRIYPLEWQYACNMALEVMVDDHGIAPIFVTPARHMHPTRDLMEVINNSNLTMERANVICFDLPAMLKNGLDHMSDMHYWSVLEHEDPDELDMVTISVPGRLNQEVYELLADLHIGDFVGNFNLQNVAHRSEPVHKQPPHNDVELHRCQAVTELVVDSVIAGGSIDFDYLIYLLTAAIIALMGLATDSVVSVIASMLVSPIMGPVMCMAFGATLGRGDIFYLGVFNELVSLGVCVLVGFLGGLLFIGLDRDEYYQWPTAQMSGRGTYRGLVEGCFVAAASGLGVAVGLMQGGINALVGVAISASLLPPVVNTGMLLSWQVTGRDLDTSSRNKHLVQAANSFLLTLLNIFLVVATAVIMFKVKEVLPRDHDSAAYWAAAAPPTKDDDKSEDSQHMKKKGSKNFHKNKGKSAESVGTAGKARKNPPSDKSGAVKPWHA